MVKEITFQCFRCQQVVDIPPDLISKIIREAGAEKEKSILVTCRDAHLNRVAIDIKTGALLRVEKGHIPT